MGRKTYLLNPLVKDTILKYIKNGNYIKTACMAAGITEACFYNWLSKAENPNGNGDSVYVDFFEELKKARQENVTERISRIQDAGDKMQNWMANAWLLERMIPGEYGKRLELEVGPSKVLIAIQEQALKALEGKPILLTSGDK